MLMYIVNLSACFTRALPHRLVLEGPLFQHYFEKVEVSNFEVASDAFSTFKVAPVQPATRRLHVLAPSCSESVLYIVVIFTFQCLYVV